MSHARAVRRIVAVLGVVAVAVAGIVQPATAAIEAADLMPSSVWLQYPKAVLVGDPVTVDVFVGPFWGTADVATGTVAISLDSGPATTLTLVEGSASLTLDGLAVGLHELRADYSGDSAFAPASRYTGEYFSVVERIAPVVTGVAPTVLPSDHPMRIAVRGSHLTGATSVTFGGVAGYGPVTSDGVLTVGIPPHAPGIVDLVVTTLAGTSNAVPVQFVNSNPGIVSLTPTRIADSWAVGDGSPTCVQVAETSGIPAGAEVVTLNVTAIAPYGPGHVVVYPDRGPLVPVPATSTVNFEVGREVANAAIVAIPPSGRICYHARGAGGARVLLDLTGFAMGFFDLSLRDAPLRVIDTRPGPGHAGSVSGPVPSGVVQTFMVGAPGAGGSTGVILNVTVTGTTAPGNLRVFPAGEPVPNASVVNYAPGNDKANLTIVKPSASGEISFVSDAGGSTAHVIIDVIGGTEMRSPYWGITPTRVLDSRPGAGRLGGVDGPLQARTAYTFDVPTSLVPGMGRARATAVVLNVTAIAPTGLGNLRVYPSESGVPDASTINYIPGRDIPNLVIVDLPDDGPATVTLYSDTGPGGTVHVAADVLGFVVDY